MKPCVECSKLVNHRSRGLCRRCYQRHDRAGTLEQFPQRRQSSEDVRYRKWLLSDPRVDASVVRPWVLELWAERESFRPIAAQTGLDQTTLARIAQGRYRQVRFSIAESVAAACGRMVELAMVMPEVGAEGWSDVGRYCGDGSELHHGCGTWWHEEVWAGLCGECFAIATGAMDMETRDIRFTREAQV